MAIIFSFYTKLGLLLLLLRYWCVCVGGLVVLHSFYCNSSAELLSRYVRNWNVCEAASVCLSVSASCTYHKQDNGLRLILMYQAFNYILEEVETSEYHSLM